MRMCTSIHVTGEVENLPCKQQFILAYLHAM